jgi:regulator of sigma E protease
VSSLKLLFSKEGAQSVGGFGTLGDLFPNQWDWYSFWQITAFLSVILAFMNIIPIPALDGGYTLFLLVEIVTRRKPSERFLEIANMIGMGFLLLLLVYANANDIYRLLLK